MSELNSENTNFGKGNLIKLIDGSGFIFRAYHALPPFTRNDGTPIGALVGFCNMLNKLLFVDKEKDNVTHIAVIFDHKGDTFRKKIFSEYKSNRIEAPEDLKSQFQLIKEATNAFGIEYIELEGYEADDIIASYSFQAEKLNAKVEIVSSDKDLMQLVSSSTLMYDPMKNFYIDKEEVFKKFGVYPEKVIDVQALSGDKVDNIPGAPGIGIKTASQLINDYGSLEKLLINANEIKQPKKRETLEKNSELIKISKQLVTLKKDIPLPLSFESLTLKSIDQEKLLNFTNKMELKSLQKRLINTLNIDFKKFNEDFLNKTKNLNDEVISKDDNIIISTPYKDYELILNINQLYEWKTKILNQGYFAIDTETTSLNEKEAELVGISISTKPGSACYIPLGHKENNKLINSQIKLSDALIILKDLLTNESILKIGQNIKYDYKIFLKYGIKLKSYDDTMLLSYVLHGGLHRHNLNFLSEKYLDHSPITIDKLIGIGKSIITFDKVKIEIAKNYAAEDADITIRLWILFKNQLNSSGVTKVYESLERPLIEVLADMENEGILISKEKLKKLSKIFSNKIDSLEKEIFKIANVKFNIGSPKQLSEILFSKMGFDKGIKNKSGTYSTSAEILENLAIDGSIFPKKILDWRQISKLKSTYTDSLLERVNSSTKRVHTSYIMSGTSTGRLSSVEPNLQNIPIRTSEGKEIRDAFISKEGSKLLSFDYSQIELRILAHIAKIPSLKEAFFEGQDIHSITASEMFNIPVQNMSPEIRRKAKAINFGVIYGISSFGLSRNLKIPINEAKKFIDTYFEKYPEIQIYMKRTIEEAKKNNYVKTLFGRKIFIPEINSKGSRGKFSERAAINAPIQGTAADIIKRAMIKIPHILEKNNLKCKMLLQVHDELIFEVNFEEISKTKKLIKKVMEKACNPIITLDVPLIVDCGEGFSWSQAH